MTSIPDLEIECTSIASAERHLDVTVNNDIFDKGEKKGNLHRLETLKVEIGD
jgi:hypothetical protein